MTAFPYAKLARAFGPKPAFTISALGHRFIQSGEVELVCRPCGFVIWKVGDAAEAAAAVLAIAGHAKPCPAASAIEARSDATPKSGAAEGESAVPNGETPS
jgi:hypothetical protein